MHLFACLLMMLVDRKSTNQYVFPPISFAPPYFSDASPVMPFVLLLLSAFVPHDITHSWWP